uniref:Uncharacterized protein n=1 Tax=Neisseria meningitidis alpha153 TaxID=663926 RepID=C6SAI0_NEIME|nr:hypothetical protein predicted by Glimmer/Critica [Neisseria meningitidis alpha153]
MSASRILWHKLQYSRNIKVNFIRVSLSVNLHTPKP